MFVGFDAEFVRQDLSRTRMQRCSEDLREWPRRHAQGVGRAQQRARVRGSRQRFDPRQGQAPLAKSTALLLTLAFEHRSPPELKLAATSTHT
eukprot:3546483-Rhodomonas_salina.3